MRKLKSERKLHEPVMVLEVVKALDTGKYAHLNNSCFVDATVGLGGHAREFVSNGIFVIGIDADASSLKITEEVLRKACPTTLGLQERGCFELLHGNFFEIDKLVLSVCKAPVQGILFDLGISSFQLDDFGRGFSFREPEQLLDMRLDKERQGVNASDILAVLDKKKLREVFAQVLPNNLALRVANVVINKREQEPIETVGDFLRLVKPLIRKKGKVDSATLPFLALRIAVNSEIENLERGLRGAINILALKGRVVVISFHSGEDRIVKTFFKNMENQKKGVLITKKPILPGGNEIAKNPRARSAKMRIFEKT
jgi:16S rRNA (cytosine1402-N4)-methyltransferase